ncbi:MAG: hypothetical protein COB85_01545 [Bacteroidetes bacterium]|nr:MAG: hypothetical protein COB85_01545 [Bacteroidota bacterium]
MRSTVMNTMSMAHMLRQMTNMHMAKTAMITVKNMNKRILWSAKTVRLASKNIHMKKDMDITMTIN